MPTPPTPGCPKCLAKRLFQDEDGWFCLSCSWRPPLRLTPLPLTRNGREPNQRTKPRR